MNLTSDPWIPIVWEDGRAARVSLEEAFRRGHEIRDLAVRPHERIALMRLLICIAQAALDGPKDRADWRTCAERLPAAAVAYLERWRHAFELFGDGQRFLQFHSAAVVDADEDSGDVSKLDLCLAAGNNSTLFDNAGGSSRGPLMDAQLAISLLTYQNYSPLVGRGYKGRSPCMEGNALHTLLLGAFLQETICLNVLTWEQISMAWGAQYRGRPVWEEWDSILRGDAVACAKATSCYLDRLCPVPRAIWLGVDRRTMAMGNGLEYPDFREATATIINRNGERVCLPADISRAAWRELHSIAVVRKTREETGGPLARQHIDGARDVTIWSGALVSDGKAKLFDAVESAYLVPAALFDAPGRGRYETGVSHAEYWCVRLGTAVARYHREMRDEIEGKQWKRGVRVKQKAVGHYWTAVEQHLSDLLAVVGRPDLLFLSGAAKEAWPQTTWGRAIARHARAAYELACPHQTPRQMKAYALGLKALFREQDATADVSAAADTDREDTGS